MGPRQADRLRERPGQSAGHRRADQPEQGRRRCGHLAPTQQVLPLRAYVSRQMDVKARYDLWVTEAEKEAMAQIVATC